MPPLNEMIELTASGRRSLQGLLLQLFSPKDLQQLAAGHEHLQDLQYSVSYTTAPQSVVFDFVQAAERRGLISRALMEILIEVRPDQEAKIRELFAQLGLPGALAASPAPAPPPAPPPSAAPSPRQVHGVLMRFADVDWENLVDFELPEAARQVILGREGRDPKARELVRYYRAAGRSLGELVEMMRRTVPNSI